MPTHLRLLPALAATLLSARAAHAAAPWEGAPLSADPAAVRTAAGALTAPPGAPLDVLLEEGIYRLDAQGAVAQTYRLVYRPMSAEAARASARVERAWAPWSEGRPEIRARVVAPDGVFTLDPSTLVEGPVEDPGGPPSARRELSGTIPGVRAGAVVEQVVTARETALVAGTVLRFRLGGGSPARLVRLRVEAPAALPLRFVVRGLELAPVETVANGVRTLVFERRDASGTPPREPGAPPELAPAPYVAFAAGQTWADVAGRVRAVLEGAIAGAELRGEARAALGAGRPKREEAVRRISTFLRARVHSTGVPVDEAPLAPRKPAEVLAKGEGNAMDLAALWVALLRAAGLEAEAALASTEWSDLPREVPGLGVFDRALVHVGGKGGAIWLDPSSPRLAPGTLPLELQGKLALVAARGTRDLVRTPASAPADNAGLTVRELHLAELGRGRVVETRELSGALAANEREFRARIPADHRDRLDERYAREVLRAGTFLGAEVRNLDDPFAPLAVRVEADESALAETGDEDALVPVGAAPVLEPLPAFLTAAREGDAAPSPRRDDVALSLPYRWEIRYRVFPPDGFRARRLPEDGVERFGPATLTRRFVAGKDGTITATYVFDTGGRRLAAADADTLAARARALAGGEPERIALERTASALLADGQVKEGLAELRRLCAAHPREAMHPLHLALALLELGDGEGAAKEARRAIALEPARAWGYRVLGWTLEHDAVGRRFGHGYDRAGALAAYRRAAELDPRHAGGRAALAELLSRGAAGVRLGPGADVGAALAEYEALRSDAGAGPYDAGLLPALFAAGRHADALALARGLTPSPERNATLVAAAAVLRGAKPAEAEADALGDDGRTALRDAAALLARDRRYPLAAALARSAARGARDADEVASFADLLASLRPWKEVAAQGDDAARLAKAVVVTALTSPDPARELEPLLSTRAVGPARAALLGGLSAPLGAVRRSLREAGVTPDLLLDVALSGLELFRDGDPATGARLRLRFAAAPGERATSLFVVREGGALRLLASEAAWPILGAEARRAAEAGDLALAARWLAWAREDAPGSVGDPGTPAGLLAALAPAGAPLDAARARLAAAALVAFAGADAAGVEILAAGRDSREPAVRRAALLALAQAHRSGGRAEAALATADALLAEDPASREAFAAKAWALRRLGRGADLSRAADAILARLPDDPEVLGLASSSRLLLGDRDGAARGFRRLVETGRASAAVYNDGAWLELFRGGASAEALGWARRAVEAAPGDHAALNTLAAVYAELGRPAEARSVFLRSLDDGRPLESADWFVAGRIAEGFALPEAARAAYGRVQPDLVDGAEDPSGANVLARRRLALLGGGRAPASDAAAPAGSDRGSRKR